METRTIPWMKLLAFCGALYGVIQLATWAINQYDGHAEKVERWDSAYVWALEAHTTIPVIRWKERRDSVDIQELKTRRK